MEKEVTDSEEDEEKETRKAKLVTISRVARKAFQCREPAGVPRIVVRAPWHSFLHVREQEEAEQRQVRRTPRFHHGQL